jgi:hypothetical protein
VNPSSAGREAEQRLAELQAALEAKEPDPRALELAGERVAAALSRLTRATPPAELARVIDLHACVRQTADRRRSETGDALQRTQAGRARLSHLTRPSDDATSLDISA